MIRADEVVFDELVVSPASYDTSSDYCEELGFFDNIAFQVVIEKPVCPLTAGSVSVAIEMSADGENWIAKSATPEINGVGFNNGQTVDAVGTTNGVPHLPFVRFRIDLGGGCTSAWVRLHAVTRDPSG